MNAFNWIEEKSTLANDFAAEPARKSYPQLDYYHRAMAAGIHPRQLKRLGLPVLDRRGEANRARAKKSENPALLTQDGASNQAN